MNINEFLARTERRLVEALRLVEAEEKAMVVSLARVRGLEAENKRLREALSRLIFTANALFQQTPAVMNITGGAFTATHPIIEQAKRVLDETLDPNSDG